MLSQLRHRIRAILHPATLRNPLLRKAIRTRRVIRIRTAAQDRAATRQPVPTEIVIRLHEALVAINQLGQKAKRS